MVTLSKHATKRIQQRDIDPYIVSLLLNYGHEQCAGKSVNKLQLPRIERKRIICRLKKMAKMLEKDPYILLSDDGIIVTAAKSYF